MAAQPSAAEEVAGLDKVLLRLGLTEEVDLEKVLARLIPAVVGSLKSPHDATRKKVLEILAHVNKRLKGAPACQLPLTPLLDMFSQPSAAPMVRSFSLVYVEMAVERCPPAQRLPAVSPLLLGVGSRPAQQSLMCLRLAACCLEGLSSPLSLGPIPGLPASTTAASSGAAGLEQPGGAEARLPGAKGAGGGGSCDPAALAAYPFLGNLVDRQAFLGYALKLLQYGPKPSASRATTALAAAQAVLATAAGTPPPPEEPALPPPGLSAVDVAALKDRAGQLPAGEVLVRRKMGVLNLLAGAGLPGRELLLPCLVAACDSADQVARRGEEMLKRQCSHEGNKPQVDLEADTQLLHALYALFLGTVASEQAGAAVAGGVVSGGALLTDIAGVAAPSSGAQTRPDAIVQPASVPVRCRVLGLLCRSVAAASLFPATLLTIQEAVYGAAAAGGAGSARLRMQGTEFAVWVSKYAASHQLKAMAPAILQGLLRTLDTSGSGSGQADPASPLAPAPPGTGGGGGGGPAATDATSLTLRGFAYQALGSLATRVPDSLQARMDIAQRFFTALADEPSGLRATVAEAASCLAAAFKSPSPALAEELGELLLTSITSPKDAVRLCAVQWANRLFPFNTVQARWLCVLAAGDSKLEVREEAARGLRLFPATLLPLAPASAPHAPPPASSSPSASNPTSSGSTAQGRAGAGGAGGAGAALVPGPHPKLEELLAYAHKQAPRLALAAEPGRSLVLPHRAYLALLRFSQSCWKARDQAGRAGAAGNDPEVLPDAKPAGAASMPAAFLTLLEGGLARDAPADLVVAALQGLVEVAGEAPAACEARFASRLALLRPLTWHVDPAARVAAARVVGVAAAGLEPTVAEQLLASLTTSLGPHTTQPTGPGASPPTPGAAPASSPPPGVGGQQQQAAGSGSASVKFEMQEGSIMAAGFVLAQCLQSPPSPSPSPPSPALHAAASALAATAHRHPLPLMAATAATALAYVALVSPLGPLLASPAATPTAAAADTTPTPTPAAAAPAPEGASAPPASSTPPPAPTAMEVEGQVAGAAADAQCSDGSAAGAGTPAPLPPSHPTSNAASTTTPAPTPAPTPTPAPAPAALSALLPGVKGPGREEVAGAVGGEVAGLIARVLDLVGDKDPKVALRAVSAAGLLAWSAAGLTSLTSTSSTSGSDEGSGSGGPPAAAAPGGAAAVAVVLRALQAGLVAKLAASKAEELQFAAGEALAFVFGGVALRPSDVLRANFSGLADQLASSGKGGSSLAGGASGSCSVEASAEGREGLQSELLGLLMKDMAVHSRAEVRCAAAVWLVSLLTFCGPQPGLRGALGDIQDALGCLLGDSHELTQEMASRGVSLVYELGDEAQKQKLVEALVGVLQGSGARAAKVKLQADTKVFEEGSIGTAPGGDALSTYQELCSLATELGQPDLVYKFMDLARHNQALNTRRGAAFGFAGIAKLAGEQLQPHVQQLVPKLFRYQYDPNPRVQESMAAVWKGLVDDPKAAVDAAFPAIMADLLKELGGRLWRSRQAAAAAMADLLQGRRWVELQAHLAQVWTMTFRAMDDIKDSVRRAAAGLARSLRGVTLRLCDPSLSPPRDAQAAVGLVLPLMLDQGITSSVEEVRGLAMSVVAAAAKQARAEALKPLLPQLVQALLEGLSSLEDTRLNYIEQHANRLGLDAERLDSARTAAAQSSSLADTLELAARVAGSDLEAGGSLEALLPVLAGIVRRGVGLNTKVGTARFIRSLAARAGSALRPHAPTLVKALTSAMRSERSNVVRKAYAAAAGQVCKHAADKRVAKVVGEAAEAYAAEGADSDARYCAGLVVRELLRAAPEVAAGHAAVTLPLAFGAKMDEDKEVAAVWKEVWEEGCASEAGALRLYAQEITALLASGLGSQHWGRKKACAQAITALAQLGGDVVSGEQVGRLATALVAEASGGRLWEGKEEVVDALGALAKAMPAALGSNVEGGAAALVATALAAAGRKKGSYRAAGLRCLESCLTAFDLDFYAQVAPPLLAAVDTHCPPTPALNPSPSPAAAPAPPPAPAPASAAGAEEGSAQPLPLIESLHCLAAAFSHISPLTAASPLPHPLPTPPATTASSSSPLPPSVTAAGLDGPPADVGGVKAGRGEGQGEGQGDTDSSSAGGQVCPAGGPSQAAAGAQLSHVLARVLASPLPWQQRQAAVVAAAAVVSRGGALTTPGPLGKPLVPSGAQEGAGGGAAKAMEVELPSGEVKMAAAAAAAAAAGGGGGSEVVGGEQAVQWAATLLPGLAACAADVQIQQVRAAALKTLAAAVAVVQHIRSSSVTGATAPAQPGGGDSDLTAARSGADLAPLPDAVRVHVLACLQRVLDTDRNASIVSAASAAKAALQTLGQDSAPADME